MKIVTDIAGKLLVALCTGAGALLAKAASEKGVGAAIKAINDKKEAAKEIATTVAEVAGDTNPAEVVEETKNIVETVAEVAEKTAEIAEEASGA